MDVHPILIVEDEPPQATALAELLEAMGHRTVVTHSAADAWEALEDGGKFSLVLLDVRMPDIDGVEFSQALRHRFPTLPVVFVSGFPVDDDESQHVFSVLRKPLTRDFLAREISRAIPAAQ